MYRLVIWMYIRCNLIVLTTYKVLGGCFAHSSAFQQQTSGLLKRGLNPRRQWCQSNNLTPAPTSPRVITIFLRGTYTRYWRVPKRAKLLRSTSLEVSTINLWYIGECSICRFFITNLLSTSLLLIRPYW